MTIEPDQKEVRDVLIDIPYHTLVTLGNVDVWIETELDIGLAVDPDDTDYLDVGPTDRLQTVFDAMDDLGFALHTADCEADPYGRYTGGRFVQEFEFRVESGPFRGDLDEAELVAQLGPDALELFVEIDRSGGLLSEMADTDERKTRTTVTSTDREAVSEQLRREIEQHA